MDSTSPESSQPDPNDHWDVDPRISLANERTFLAWIRTALGFLAGGIVVAQVLGITGSPISLDVVGVGLILFSASIAVLSYRRWKRNERRFAEHLSLEHSRLPGLLTALMVIVAAIAMLLTLLLRS